MTRDSLPGEHEGLSGRVFKLVVQLQEGNGALAIRLTREKRDWKWKESAKGTISEDPLQPGRLRRLEARPLSTEVTTKELRPGENRGDLVHSSTG